GVDRAAARADQIGAVAVETACTQLQGASRECHLGSASAQAPVGGNIQNSAIDRGTAAVSVRSSGQRQRARTYLGQRAEITVVVDLTTYGRVRIEASDREIESRATAHTAQDDVAVTLQRPEAGLGSRAVGEVQIRSAIKRDGGGAAGGRAVEVKVTARLNVDAGITRRGRILEICIGPGADRNARIAGSR